MFLTFFGVFAGRVFETPALNKKPKTPQRRTVFRGSSSNSNVIAFQPEDQTNKTLRRVKVLKMRPL
jgi:hypothetical protein